MLIIQKGSSARSPKTAVYRHTQQEGEDCQSLCQTDSGLRDYAAAGMEAFP